jgi:hypothetical protein
MPRSELSILERKPTRVQMQLHVHPSAKKLLYITTHLAVAEVTSVYRLNKKRGDQSVGAKRLQYEPERLAFAAYLAPN